MGLHGLWEGYRRKMRLWGCRPQRSIETVQKCTDSLASVCHPSRLVMVTSTAQRRALRLLAGSPYGCTVANMLAHGFTNATLDGLVRDGLATIQPGTVRTGTRRITVVWVTITEVGLGVRTVQ
jgi:hypothetical protein